MRLKQYFAKKTPLRRQFRFTVCRREFFHLLIERESVNSNGLSIN